MLSKCARAALATDITTQVNGNIAAVVPGALRPCSPQALIVEIVSAERIVDETVATGSEPGQPQRTVTGPERLVEVAGESGLLKVAESQIGAGGTRHLRGLADHVNGAAGRVTSVERALGTFQYFDALQIEIAVHRSHRSRLVLPVDEGRNARITAGTDEVAPHTANIGLSENGITGEHQAGDDVLQTGSVVNLSRCKVVSGLHIHAAGNVVH